MKRFVILMFVGTALVGAEWHDGWKSIAIRSVAQDVYRIPSTKPVHSTAILFLPGDGGWRGAAKDMAQTISASGYDVFVWDTKQYLTSMTGKYGGIKETDLGPDFTAMRGALAAFTQQPIVIVGWSQGAAMVAVAAANSGTKKCVAGVILMSLPDSGVLAWRWKDNLTYLTGGTPKEPMFQTEPYLSQISPLPIAVIQAGRDRFTPTAVSKSLLRQLRRPHRLRTLDEAEHDFGPDRSLMYKELNEALHWIDHRHHRSHLPDPELVATPK